MTESHKNIIEASRVGGFGSSDAKLLYKIGSKGLGSLSNTDKKRIRVAKGLDEYQPIPLTEAMQKGHDFEDWYEKTFFDHYEGRPYRWGYEREKLLTADFVKNFKVFAHCDFFNDNEVTELKCVQFPDLAETDYKEQLQWFYLFGVDAVFLVTCDSTAVDFESGINDPKFIDKNPNIVLTLSKGIQILDQEWEHIDLTISEDWHESDLLPFEKMEIDTFTNYLQQIKTLEAEAETMKQKIFDFMQKNNIKSISSDFYNVSLVPESFLLTFDKKKLFKDYPEINEQDYVKTSPRKAYLTVKLK